MDQLTTNVRTQSWIQMLQAQKNSGMSIERWCKENNISTNCFYYRQSKLRELAGEQLTQFVEIQQPAPSAKTEPYLDNLTNSAASIVSGNVVIGLSNNASEELIARIVKVLHAQ